MYPTLEQIYERIKLLLKMENALVVEKDKIQSKLDEISTELSALTELKHFLQFRNKKADKNEIPNKT